MGFHLSSSKKKTSARRTFSPMNEINVTPMVDVMLVLLVIFMVTAPLLTTGIPVDLPKTKAASLSEPIEPLTITVNADGKIFIQETEVVLEDLTTRLRDVTQNNAEARIYVRGDQGLNYGQIIKIMGLIGDAGFTKVALLTEPLKGSKTSSSKSSGLSKKTLKG